MTTIQAAADIFSPALVRAYRVLNAPRSIVHEIIGGGVNITIKPAGPRTGSMELLFLDEATGDACRAAHAAGQVLAFSDPAAPTTAMSYTATEVELTEDEALGWWVKVSWQEIPQ